MAATQWNRDFVKAEDALALLPQVAGRVSWAGVRVALLDTGYREHRAFGPWRSDGTNAIVQTKQSRDFFQPKRKTGRDPLNKVPLQTPGHGTRSGSVLSGRDLAGGFLGVAPGLPLVPFRVNDNSLVSGKAAKAIGRALKHVAKKGLAPVVNISLGFPLVLDREMGEGLDEAYEAGVIVVAAAGQLVDKVVYPAKHRRALAVAGIKRNRRGRFQIYYRYDDYSRIDCWAPAEPILRADLEDDDQPYGTGDGTTYGAVHVSAAAAIWLRHHGRQIDRRYGRTWMRTEAFRRILFRAKGRLPFASPATNDAGALDIARLLAEPLPDPTTLKKEMDRAADDVM